MSLFLRLAAVALGYLAYRISDTALCVPVFAFALLTWITAGRLREIEKP